MVLSLVACAEDGGKGQYLLCLESSDVSNISADLQVQPWFPDHSTSLSHRSNRPAADLAEVRRVSRRLPLSRQQRESSSSLCRLWVSSQRSTQGA